MDIILYLYHVILSGIEINVASNVAILCYLPNCSWLHCTSKRSISDFKVAKILGEFP